MGIKQLNTLLKLKCPEVYRPCHLSHFAFKKIAIDVSIFLCKFKTTSANWLNAFLTFVQVLRRNDVHPVFVFDNTPPVEKTDTRRQRREQQNKIKQKIIDIEEAINVYASTQRQHNKDGGVTKIVIAPILQEIHDAELRSIHNIKNKSTAATATANTNNQTTGIASYILPLPFNINLVRSKLIRIKRQIIDIQPSDYEDLKELFRALGVAYIQGASEAETTCADLCIRNVGEVCAVLSEDSDVLAYGTPTFLCKLDLATETCYLVDMQDVLTRLNMTYPNFRDLCICGGCDYNNNMPRYGIVKMYTLFQKYETFENIIRHVEFPTQDVTNLKMERVRELFSIQQKYYPPENTTPLHFTKPININLLTHLSLRKNLTLWENTIDDFTNSIHAQLSIQSDHPPSPSVQSQSRSSPSSKSRPVFNSSSKHLNLSSKSHTSKHTNSDYRSSPHSPNSKSSASVLSCNELFPWV